MCTVMQFRDRLVFWLVVGVSLLASASSFAQTVQPSGTGWVFVCSIEAGGFKQCQTTATGTAFQYADCGPVQCEVRLTDDVSNLGIEGYEWGSGSPEPAERSLYYRPLQSPDDTGGSGGVTGSVSLVCGPPLCMSTADGALLAAAIGAVWLTAWGLRMAVRVMRGREDGD